MKHIFMIIMLGAVGAMDASQLSKAEKNAQKQEDVNRSMWIAVYEENKDSLQTLEKLFAAKTKIKPDINNKNKEGHTPLFLAAIRGNLAIAQFLITHGAQINMQDKKGMTPLFAAVQAHFLNKPTGNIPMIRFLAAAGAKDSIVDKNGNMRKAIAYTPVDENVIQKAIDAGKQEYALVLQAYEERKKAAHRQLQQHIIPDLATIVTDYAFEEGSPEDLLAHSGTTEKGCVIS